MIIFAHRGFSGEYPENTMRAYQAALEAGTEGIELDVHLSRDGVPVIIHDETLDRTTAEKGLVCERDAGELTGIDAAKVKGKTFAEPGVCPIPLLEDYCRWVKTTNLVTNIEIKTDGIYYPGVEEKTLDLVKRYGLEDRIIFSSFNWLSVVRMKALAPHIPCGFLRENTTVRHIAALIKTMGFEYYHPDHDIFDQAQADYCREQGVGLNVWTVNTEEQFRDCAAWGVHGVIGNYPDKLKQWRNKTR